MSKKNISIKEIAEMADVSIATVSRVINKNGRFSKETEQKVLKIINESGYVSNRAGKTLRSSKSNTIGLIIPNINNDFFSSIALIVESFFSEYGYSVFICNTNNDSKKELNYWKTLNSNLVDGIICISSLYQLPKNINLRNIPVVYIDRRPSNQTDSPLIYTDDFYGSYIATLHLIEQGCKNIVFLNSYTAEYESITRFNGYSKALSDNDIEINNNLVKRFEDDTPSYISSEIAISNLITNNIYFDGIISTSDRIALGALYALKRNNIEVPEEVKIVGYDNSIYSKITFPSITTISRNIETLATQGAQTLFNLMNKMEPESNNIKIPVTLVKRLSTEK